MKSKGAGLKRVGALLLSLFLVMETGLPASAAGNGWQSFVFSGIAEENPAAAATPSESTAGTASEEFMQESPLSAGSNGSLLYYGIVCAEDGSDAVLFMSNHDLKADSLAYLNTMISNNLGELNDSYVPALAGVVSNDYSLFVSNRPWVSRSAEWGGAPVTRVIIEKDTVLSAYYSMAYWFYDMENLVSADLGCLNLRLSVNASMERMFQNCKALEEVSNLPVGGTGNKIQSMFYYCTSITELDLREFDCAISDAENAFSDMHALRRINLSGKFRFNTDSDILQNITKELFSDSDHLEVIEKGAFSLGVEEVKDGYNYCTNLHLKGTFWYDEEDQQYTNVEMATTERPGKYRKVFRDVRYYADEAAEEPVADSLSWENRETDQVKSAAELGFEKENYTFYGWSTEPDGTGSIYYPGDYFNRDGEPYVDLYGVWYPLTGNSEIDIETVRLTFDRNGGKALAVSEIVLKKGQTYYRATGTDLPVAESETAHCHSEGWYTAAEGGTPVTQHTAVTEDLVIYPHWTADIHTVAFESNGGTAVDSAEAVYGNRLTEPAAPTKEQTVEDTYTFAGWCRDEACTELWDFSKDTVTENMTLYAKWTAEKRKYSVYFIWYGERGTIQKAAYGSTAERPADPTKEPTAAKMYTFEGWYKESACKTAWDFDADLVTGNVFVYAKWSEKPREYAVTFETNGGSRVSAQSVVYGNTVTKPADPEKAATVSAVYTFEGWYSNADCTLAWEFAENTINADQTLYAKWTETPREYTVTFETDGGSKVASQTLVYGEKVTRPVDPRKAASAAAGYAFEGWYSNADCTLAWEFDKDTVAGDQTLYAKWRESTRKYTVTFKDEDGRVLQKSNWAYGTTPTCPEPNKLSTRQNSYTFTGWEPALTKVTGEAEYRAVYSSTDLKYTVTFKDEDGTVLQKSDWAYGTTPTCPAPAKASTAQYSYTFTGWSPVVTAVTGTAEYKAVYSSAVRKYSITFRDSDGTVLQKSDWAYGATPACPAPAKASTAQYSYTFTGWSPALAEVTGEAEYKAVYSSAVREYTVTFKDEDGTVLQEGDWAYGETPACPAPAKASTAQYSYTFTGWSPALAEVTGEAEYTAVYSAAVRKYTVTFKNEDGTVLQKSDWTYGEKPTCPVPIKASTAMYSYLFAGWTPAATEVKGTAEYQATYTLSKIESSGTQSEENSGSSTGSSSTGSTGTASSTGSGSSSGIGSSGIIVSSGSVLRNPTMRYSSFWYQDATGGWRIRDGKGNDVCSAWVCDDAYWPNGKNAWYLIGADGYMVTSRLVKDSSGHLYCLNQEHNGNYGMVLYNDTVIGQIPVHFSQDHSGYFGAVVGEESITALLKEYKAYETDITKTLYSSVF